jgi:hypothetical protein
MVDQRGVEDLKYLVFTYPYRYQSGDLKLCTFSFSFGDVYHQDGKIQLQAMVDPREVEGV